MLHFGIRHNYDMHEEGFCDQGGQCLCDYFYQYGTSRGGGYPQAGVKIGTVVCDMIIISKKTMTKYNF